MGMTKLEEEIARHIEDEYEGETNHLKPYYDKLGQLASEIAVKYIENAYREGVSRKTIFGLKEYMEQFSTPSLERR